MLVVKLHQEAVHRGLCIKPPRISFSSTMQNIRPRLTRQFARVIVTRARLLMELAFMYESTYAHIREYR